MAEENSENQAREKPPRAQSADVCRVLADMVEVMDEHYDRRDEHYMRRERMLDRIVKGLQFGIILIGLVAIALNAQLFKLVDGVDEDMEIMSSQIMQMRESMLAIQTHMALVSHDMNSINRNMQAMTEAVVPMAEHVRAIHQSLAQVRQDMEGVHANLQTIDEKMSAMPPLQQNIHQMASTMERMQQDTQIMRYGVHSVSRDTSAMSSPFRMMPWP